MAVKMADLHWASGFLEGEGSFTAVRAGRRPDGRPRDSFNIMVHAGQLNQEPLMRLKSIFGGNIYRHNNHTDYPMWRWQICGRKAVGIMMTLWTMMSERRRDQIETSLAKFMQNAQPLSSYRLGR